MPQQASKEYRSYVLMTWGSEGIELELARLFAADGHSIILVARDGAQLASAAAALKKDSAGVQVVTIVKDPIPIAAAGELIAEIASRAYSKDTRVNNAGLGAYGLFTEQDQQREIDILHLNVISLTKHYPKEMVARKSGRVLNLSSISGKIPGPYQSVYHGTRAFLQNCTEAIRAEVENQGVIITSLLPGASGTDFFSRAEMLNNKIVQDKNNLASPAEVAKDGYKALLARKNKFVSRLKKQGTGDHCAHYT